MEQTPTCPASKSGPPEDFPEERTNEMPFPVDQPVDLGQPAEAAM